MRRTLTHILIATLTLAIACGATAAPPKRKLIKLPGADLKQRVIWGAQATNPDGFALAFGGLDQQADDARPHTRIKRDGRWVSIVDDLRQKNPLQSLHGRLTAENAVVRVILARARHLYFEGMSGDETQQHLAAKVHPLVEKLGRIPFKQELAKTGAGDSYHRRQADRAAAGAYKVQSADNEFRMGATGADIGVGSKEQIALEKLAELLDAEPGARALSPIVWEPRHKVFVLFGGDHLDFLRNDIWVFDPAKMRWEQRHQDAAPAPRANHTLKANGDGTITVSGGYTYFNDVWYMGPAYKLHQDGEWTYDLALNKWTNNLETEGVPSGSRTYRGKLFHPLTYVKGPKPDREATAKKLADLPDNQWVVMDPPLKPKMNRDWGSACIDLKRDVMLQWSGGHSAHGGSDVAIYHFATNRWELPFPVEFPLGQMYSNTSYPNGFNFNRRPWVSAHTYKCFGYDTPSGRMLFVGHNPWTYLWDTGVGDWVGRLGKPKAMSYPNPFYTLTCERTDKGLLCWAAGGKVFRFEAEAKQWKALEAKGRLPSPSVDASGMAWDSKRNRLVMFPTAYGKPFAGKVVTFEIESGRVKLIEPPGIEVARTLPGLARESVYLPEDDVVLILAATLAPAEGEKTRRTLGFDCARERWVVYTLGGKNPAGSRNVSLGVVHDPKRNLVGACESRNQVWGMRPKLAEADKTVPEANPGPPPIGETE
jgi:hypothetical protein